MKHPDSEAARVLGHGPGAGHDPEPRNGCHVITWYCVQGQAVFPADWPGTMDSPSSMVRTRVELKRKGVAHRGATLFADDVSTDGRGTSAEPEAESMADEPLHPTTEAMTEMTETVAMEESTAVLSAEPSPEAMVEDQAEPPAEETSIGHVTSELPRGASRSAAATAVCSAAAVQRLRHDVQLHCVTGSAASSWCS